MTYSLGVWDVFRLLVKVKKEDIIPVGELQSSEGKCTHLGAEI